MPIKKPGRPLSGEPTRPTLTTVSFCADAATLAVLQRLEEREHGPRRGRRSQAIRRALHAADEVRKARGAVRP